jgi:hypothetical protein
MVSPPSIATPSINDHDVSSTVQTLDRRTERGISAGSSVECGVMPNPQCDAHAGADGKTGRAAVLGGVHKDDKTARDVLKSGGWVYEDG